MRRTRKSGPADLPTGAGRRFARLALAGAGVAGRAALGELRKLGAGSEERQGIDDATREANAQQVFAALSELRGPFLKLGQVLSTTYDEGPKRERWRAE